VPVVYVQLDILKLRISKRFSKHQTATATEEAIIESLPLA
jgi:hypothetical protein